MFFCNEATFSNAAEVGLTSEIFLHAVAQFSVGLMPRVQVLNFFRHCYAGIMLDSFASLFNIVKIMLENVECNECER